MIAVGYRRESSLADTVEQAYDYQGERLTEYGCQWIFGDRISGRKKNRNGLSQALSKIDSGEADELVVTHIFRLGRSLDAYRIIKHIENKGGKVTVLSGMFNTVTPEGRAFLKIQLVLGEMEAEQGAERQKIGWQNSIGKGRPRSKLFGYQISNGKYIPDLTPIDGELTRFHIAGSIIEKYFETRSLKKTAEWIRSNPHWFTGKKQENPSPHPTGVRQWLCREALQGHVRLKGILHKDQHPALITEPERIKEIEIIANRRSGYSSEQKHPYSGLVFCRKCDNKLTVGKNNSWLTESNAKKFIKQGKTVKITEDGKFYHPRLYYRCGASKIGRCDNTKIIRESDIDLEVRRVVTDHIEILAAYILRTNDDPIPSIVLELQSKIDKLSILKDDPKVQSLIEEFELEIKNHLQKNIVPTASVDQKTFLEIANSLVKKEFWTHLNEDEYEKGNLLRVIIKKIWIQDKQILQVDWVDFS